MRRRCNVMMTQLLQCTSFVRWVTYFSRRKLWIWLIIHDGIPVEPWMKGPPRAVGGVLKSSQPVPTYPGSLGHLQTTHSHPGIHTWSSRVNSHNAHCSTCRTPHIRWYLRHERRNHCRESVVTDYWKPESRPIPEWWYIPCKIHGYSIAVCATMVNSSPWTKWPPFRRRYFQIHFHEWKILYFD